MGSRSSTIVRLSLGSSPHPAWRWVASAQKGDEADLKHIRHSGHSRRSGAWTCSCDWLGGWSALPPHAMASEGRGHDPRLRESYGRKSIRLNSTDV